MQVLEFLKTHSFADLKEMHGVIARRNATLDKVSLNYDQLLAKSGNPIAEECRGLVIRPADLNILRDSLWETNVVGNVSVLARPLNRFYNATDPAAKINLSDSALTVYEKLDGTLIILYWDELHNKWCAATRSVPEADIPVRNGDIKIGNMTFSDLFFAAICRFPGCIKFDSLNESLYKNLSMYDKAQSTFNSLLNKDITYLFELTSPHNRVVVKYEDIRATLLAGRVNSSGKEVKLSQFEGIFFLPKTFKLRNLNDIIKFVENKNPQEFEGVVLKDSMCNRVKIKNAAWVIASRAKDAIVSSKRSVLELIIKEKIDDFLPLLNDDSVKEEVIKMQDSFRNFLINTDEKFREFKALANGDRKTFAGMVMTAHRVWPAIFFHLWEGKSASAREYFSSDKNITKSTLDTVLKIINSPACA